MEICTDKDNYTMSRIVPLPFVNNPPSAFDKIFTVLFEADRKCKKLGQLHCFCSFDQPLCWKTQEILDCADPNSEQFNLSSVITRLGGFHTLMSFLGNIGFIMDGSGLKDVLGQIYAANSLDNILSGHAYSRDVGDTNSFTQPYHL